MLSPEELRKKLAKGSLQVSCGCHIWLRSESVGGYGRISIGEQQMDYAHRVSYRVNHGEIPLGFYVMHSCDIPACVNPAHLSVGTQADNMRDCAHKGRTRNGNPKGEGNGRAKFNDQTALAAYHDPRPLAEIAETYGVTVTAVRLLKGGRTWQHVHS